MIIAVRGIRDNDSNVISTRASVSLSVGILLSSSVVFSRFMAVVDRRSSATPPTNRNDEALDY